MYQKKSVTKNVLLNSYSSMKKYQKHSDDFWHRKLTLKVRFWHFLTLPHYTNSQNSMISFDYSWFLAKHLSNFVSLPWKLDNRYYLNPDGDAIPAYFLYGTYLRAYLYSNSKICILLLRDLVVTRRS